MSDPLAERQYAFTVALTMYAVLKQSSKGKSTTKRQEKSVKTKELLFSLSEDNYIEFLESILEKHGQTQYKISSKQRFSFKFTMPKTKSQRTSEAMDVDNESDYKEMVRKIHDAASDPGAATKILVDMKHVEKLPSRQANGHSGDEESSTVSDDNQPLPSRSASDLDARLARWRIKLVRMYKNDNDGCLTYIAPSGATISLTPAMVLDWARALEEGQATLNMPPNIPSFDAANKALFLHPARKAQAQAAASSNPASDINSLTSVLLLQTLANLSSAGTCSPSTTNTSTVVPIPPAPTTPVRRVPERSSSPPVPSPSQLMRFLRYAETELHVENATTYERRLAGQRIGPDILPEIGDKILAAEIGIPAGDIVRLKKGSITWWGDHAKRKRSNTDQSSTSQSRSPTRQPQKRVAYKKTFHDGGGQHFTGPPMTAGDGDDDVPKDYDLWYQSTDHGAWLPVPRGFVVCEDGHDDGLDT